MGDRGFILTSQAIRRHLAAMPNEPYLVRLIHNHTRKAFPGERLWTAAQLGSAATVRFLRARNREGYEVYSVEDQRQSQIRTIREVAQDYLDSYALRNRSTTFARYAVNHVVRLLGEKMIVDVDEGAVREYQDRRLRESAAPKTINEEVGFLVRLLGDRGDLVRARLRKQKLLKLKSGKRIAKVYSSEEKQRLAEAAREARSPAINPTLMLGFNAALRNGEIRNLKWEQIDFKERFLTLGKSKTEAGEGRTIPHSMQPCIGR